MVRKLFLFLYLASGTSVWITEREKSLKNNKNSSSILCAHLVETKGWHIPTTFMAGSCGTTNRNPNSVHFRFGSSNGKILIENYLGERIADINPKRVSVPLQEWAETITLLDSLKLWSTIPISTRITPERYIVICCNFTNL